jgi:ribonucleoside-diphosphate reductase alpha chain
MSRKTLQPRRSHITQKVSIGGIRTCYLSVDSTTPSELFIRVKERNMEAEVVTLYDTLARVSSLALQHGVPLEKIGETLIGVKSDPGGPVQGDDKIKFCAGPLDWAGRHILVHYCNRTELAHVKEEA